MQTLCTLFYRSHKAGYDIYIDLVSDGKGLIFPFKYALNPDGIRIGEPSFAHFICVRMGIRPEPRTSISKVCSIGYSKKKNRWYGWSHRAILGFAIGDKVSEDHICASELPIGFEAKTIEDARTMAIVCAKSVA